MENNVMTTPQQVQWLKLLMDKDMTSARWMALVANLAFVAMLDVNSDLSNPDAVFAALGVEMVPFGEPMKLPAHTRFVAVEKFIKNTGADAELPISNIEKNFREHFLGVDEKVIKPSTLKKFRLLKLSLGMRILNILGCTKEKKTALAHVYDFLKTAKRSRWYLFYVEDENGTVWVVRSFWFGDGWSMGASAVASMIAWHTGAIVVSP